MPKRLTIKEQRALLKALPASRKKACMKHCRDCQMKGKGLKDVIKSIGKTLGPVFKEIGPTVLKEFLLPMLKSGGGLKLAGQGKGKKKPVKRKVGRPKKKSV